MAILGGPDHLGLLAGNAGGLVGILVASPSQSFISSESEGGKGRGNVPIIEVDHFWTSLRNRWSGFRSPGRIFFNYILM